MNVPGFSLSHFPQAFKGGVSKKGSSVRAAPLIPADRRLRPEPAYLGFNRFEL